MRAVARRSASALLLGLIFGLGLVVSGMTQPSKVFAFLDITGAWDPSLAFVMGGAIASFAFIFRIAHRRAAPLLGGRFPKLPTRPDARLLGGAALFGAGWGLSGICPGPALVDLGAGLSDVAIFVVAMVAGMQLHRLVGMGVSGAALAPPAEAAPRESALGATPQLGG